MSMYEFGSWAEYYQYVRSKSKRDTTTEQRLSRKSKRQAMSEFRQQLREWNGVLRVEDGKAVDAPKSAIEVHKMSWHKRLGTIALVGIVVAPVGSEMVSEMGLSCPDVSQMILDKANDFVMGVKAGIAELAEIGSYSATDVPDSGGRSDAAALVIRAANGGGYTFTAK